MKITHTTSKALLCLVLSIFSCDSSNDEKAPFELKLRVGNSVYDLTNPPTTNVYEDKNVDKVNDASSTVTHRLVRLSINDADYANECPALTYWFDIDFWYPINSEVSGTYTLMQSSSSTGSSSTRGITVGGYYDLGEGSTECNWVTPYKQWHDYNKPAPKGTVKLKANADGTLTFSMGKYHFRNLITTPNGWEEADGVYVSFGLIANLN